MPDSNTLTLDKAVNLRQLKMAHDAAVHFGEATDPTAHDFIDEYKRVLAALYQALEDAQQVTEPALEAAGIPAALRGLSRALRRARRSGVGAFAARGRRSRALARAARVLLRPVPGAL